MYKGCTRDTQGTNTLATPEQHRSNTGATLFPLARTWLWGGFGWLCPASGPPPWQPPPGGSPGATRRQKLAGFPAITSDDPPIWECPPDACSGSCRLLPSLDSFSTRWHRSRQANPAMKESLSTIGFPEAT